MYKSILSGYTQTVDKASDFVGSFFCARFPRVLALAYSLRLALFPQESAQITANIMICKLNYDEVYYAK